MTPKQIQKSIAAAEKALAKATKNVAMYRTRRDNAMVKAEKSGVNVSTEMFKTEWSCANHCSVRYIANNVDVWSIVYPITNAWESMLENEYWMEKHARRIESLKSELASIENAEIEITNMVDILEPAMAEFKAQWFDKMTAWHMNHYNHIQTILPAMRERHAHIKRIERRATDIYGHYMLGRNFTHARTRIRLGNAAKACAEVMMDTAAINTMDSYMVWANEQITITWNACMKTLVSKLDRFNINLRMVNVTGIAVTEKGFECIITDGRDRSIYARMIWAAEYSAMVAPHTRYIITERKS